MLPRCLIAATSLIAFASPWIACAAGETPLTIVGGDDAVWAFRAMEPDADGARRLQFAYGVPGKSGMRFRRLRIAPSSGDIVLAAVRGVRLNVFFSEGAHYRFQPPNDRRSPTEPAATDFPEVNLPDNHVPFALCGDDVTNRLGAVIETTIADQLAADDITTTGPDAPAEDASKTDEAPAAPASRYTLVEYVGNEWQPALALPAVLDDLAGCLLAAHGGTYHFVYRSKSAPNELRYISWTAGQGAWSAPESIAPRGMADVLALVAGESTVALAYRDVVPGGGGWTVRALVRRDDGWQSQAPLRREGQDATFTAGRVAVHRFGGELAVATLDDGADGPFVSVGFWPVAGGDPKEAPRDIVALGQQPDPAEVDQRRMLIATVVLVLTLLIVFARRRESFLVDLPLPAGYVLGSLGKRMAAVLVDLLLVLFFAIPILVMPWLARHGVDLEWGADARSQIDEIFAENPDKVFWGWMAIAGMFIVYATLFEGICAATPGKLIFGLRVFTSKGQRCTWAAAVVRNLLRLEFYPLFQFVPTAILVALTRNRQRLGDLVARTTVAERAADVAKTG